MILIRFPDAATEQKALGFLAGRFSFKSWATGETLVPPAALASLALAGIECSAVGPAEAPHLNPLLHFSGHLDPNDPLEKELLEELARQGREDRERSQQDERQ